MTEEEFTLTQERISNVEAHCKSLERDMAEYMADNPKGNDQWIEKRVRVLEDKVKYLMDELKHAKGTSPNSGRDAPNNVPTGGVSEYSDLISKINR